MIVHDTLPVNAKPPGQYDPEGFVVVIAYYYKLLISAISFCKVALASPKSMRFF
jgi:hypothetical protein